MPFEIITEATLGSAVRSICRTVSYPVPSDVTASTDPKILQMIAACNAASAELFSIYEWAELTTQGVINIAQDVPDQPEKGFPLPADWFRFIDQTQWDGSQQRPAFGPVTPQGWMAYLVMPITSVFQLTWQMREGQVWFLTPPPAPGVDFRFMYYSRALVRDADDATLLKNIASKNGDVFRLDGALVTNKARSMWLAWNGFDNLAAERDFQVLYDARVGASKAAPILTASRTNGVRLLDANNLPDTGIGR